MRISRWSFQGWITLYGVLVLTWTPSFSLDSWMHLGVSSLAAVPQDRGTCSSVPGLVDLQQQECLKNPESILCVSRGAKAAITECQKQFKFERWNCTTSQNYSVFGPVLKKGTRETAFIYAILSAGVVHAVTTACSLGNLTDCSCDTSRYGEHTVEGWKWGGCSDNIHYGVSFSKRFVDAPETLMHQSSQNLRNKMNLHNNEVGRQVIEGSMKLRCRCHGVSGSCAVQTCWKSLPDFHQIGEKLKTKYEWSVRIARRARNRLRRRDKTKRNVPVEADNLVYVHRSPNYCRSNPKKGILGTRGRLCNKTVSGPESCDLLCCGRGYNTQVLRHVERCHCKFIWCCDVQCKKCETLIDKYTCK
ncbi:protein Wnt-16-like [Ylistrum balloti]|uniref:protein Wnt-16-like n=1 Tax=Ylistrum balloti TaxID=509963 RepID=UPI0029059384|nr:protein Wnt-16-like [Ylistrum balloti]